MKNCEGGALEDTIYNICVLSPDFEESQTVGALGGGLIKGGLIIVDSRSGLAGHSSASDDVCRSNPLEKIVECEQTTVDSHLAWRRKLPHNIQVGIVKNGHFILSLQAIYTDASERDVLKTFNQLVGTFKFAR
jgi:hypothetical protein